MGRERSSFCRWEIYHVKGSGSDPNRLYASQTSGWFGQIIQRSDDGGKTWFQPGTPPGEPTTTPEGMPVGESNKFVYDTSSETGKPLTTHQWYNGKPHPWEFKRVWHLEPSLDDPDTVYAGVEDAALFRSTNGGQTWAELPGLRGHGTSSAAGDCVGSRTVLRHWCNRGRLSTIRNICRGGPPWPPAVIVWSHPIDLSRAVSATEGRPYRPGTLLVGPCS